MARTVSARPTVDQIRQRAETAHDYCNQAAERYEPRSEMRDWIEGKAEAFAEVLAWIDGTEDTDD
jgi:hypothetical protein